METRFQIVCLALFLVVLVPDTQSACPIILHSESELENLVHEIAKDHSISDSLIQSFSRSGTWPPGDGPPHNGGGHAEEVMLRRAWQTIGNAFLQGLGCESHQRCPGKSSCTDLVRRAVNFQMPTVYRRHARHSPSAASQGKFSGDLDTYPIHDIHQRPRSTPSAPPHHSANAESQLASETGDINSGYFELHYPQTENLSPHGGEVFMYDDFPNEMEGQLSISKPNAYVDNDYYIPGVLGLINTFQNYPRNNDQQLSRYSHETRRQNQRENTQGMSNRVLPPHPQTSWWLYQDHLYGRQEHPVNPLYPDDHSGISPQSSYPGRDFRANSGHHQPGGIQETAYEQSVKQENESSGHPDDSFNQQINDLIPSVTAGMPDHSQHKHTERLSPLHDLKRTQTLNTHKNDSAQGQSSSAGISTKRPDKVDSETLPDGIERPTELGSKLHRSSISDRHMLDDKTSVNSTIDVKIPQNKTLPNSTADARKPHNKTPPNSTAHVRNPHNKTLLNSPADFRKPHNKTLPNSTADVRKPHNKTPPNSTADVRKPHNKTPPNSTADVRKPHNKTPPNSTADVRKPHNKTPPNSTADVRKPHNKTPPNSTADVRKPHNKTPPNSTADVRKPHNKTPPNSTADVRKPHNKTPPNSTADVRKPHNKTLPNSTADARKPHSKTLPNNTADVRKPHKETATSSTDNLMQPNSTADISKPYKSAQSKQTDGTTNPNSKTQILNAGNITELNIKTQQNDTDDINKAENKSAGIKIPDSETQPNNSSELVPRIQMNRDDNKKRRIKPKGNRMRRKKSKRRRRLRKKRPRTLRLIKEKDKEHSPGAAFAEQETTTLNAKRSPNALGSGIDGHANTRNDAQEDSTLETMHNSGTHSHISGTQRNDNRAHGSHNSHHKNSTRYGHGHHRSNKTTPAVGRGQQRENAEHQFFVSNDDGNDDDDHTDDDDDNRRNHDNNRNREEQEHRHNKHTSEYNREHHSNGKDETIMAHGGSRPALLTNIPATARTTTTSTMTTTTTTTKSATMLTPKTRKTSRVTETPLQPLASTTNSLKSKPVPEPIIDTAKTLTSSARSREHQPHFQPHFFNSSLVATRLLFAGVIWMVENEKCFAFSPSEYHQSHPGSSTGSGFSSTFRAWLTDIRRDSGDYLREWVDHVCMAVGRSHVREIMQRGAVSYLEAKLKKLLETWNTERFLEAFAGSGGTSRGSRDGIVLRKKCFRVRDIMEAVRQQSGNVNNCDHYLRDITTRTGIAIFTKLMRGQRPETSHEPCTLDSASQLFDKFGDAEAVSGCKHDKVLTVQGLQNLLDSFQNSSCNEVANISSRDSQLNTSKVDRRSSHQRQHSSSHSSGSNSWNTVSSQKYSARELMDLVLKNRSDTVTIEQFYELCPSLLEQALLSSQSSYANHEFAERPDVEYVVQATDLQIFGLGTAAVAVITMCSLLGAVMVRVCRGAGHHYAMAAMIGLAVGNLCGDAILHLVPEALAVDDVHDSLANQHDQHSDHDDDDLYRLAGGLVVTHVRLKCLALLTTIYVFWLIEILTSRHGEIEGEPNKQKPAVNERGSRSSAEEAQTIPMSTLAESTEVTLPKQTCDSQNVYEVIPPQLLHQRKPTIVVESREFKNSSRHLVWMIVVGDAVHNLADGLAIGAAFAHSVPLGLSTSLAVVCHEIPHELGDFAVLLSTGMKVRKALLLNLLSAMTAFVGLYIGLGVGAQLDHRQWIFIIVAGMFLYVALADLVPELVRYFQHFRNVRMFAVQSLGLLSGFALMFLLVLLEDVLHF